MPRVVIIGNSGGGKSTLARQLAERRGLRHVEVDRLLWREGWVLAPAEEYARLHQDWSNEVHRTMGFLRRNATMTQVGTGDYRYEVIRDFFKSPDGEPFGLISRVAADDQDRIYVFQRRDPPVVVFDRNGKHLASWGAGDVTDPHGLKIVGDTVYTTDRADSVAKSFSLDGKVKLALGTAGQHSDTGKVENWLAERAAGPFNHPTEMLPHPNGDIYITDGYRNARVHRFAADGKLKTSWGAPGSGPGQFHLPHSIALDDAGNLLVADRSNRRIQFFTPEGQYLSEWTGMGGPNDISRGKDGNYYIAEQEADGNPAYCTVRSPTGEVLAKMESRHVHGIGVDSHGDIYAGLTQNRGVDKFVRVR